MLLANARRVVLLGTIASIVALLPLGVQAATTDVKVNGKKIGEIEFTKCETRQGVSAAGTAWGGADLRGGYKETDAAAAAAAGCAQLRWIQTITTNKPARGCTSPYVDPWPNPDGSSPYYWDDTDATSGADYGIDGRRNSNGKDLWFEDLPSRSKAGAPVDWCAVLCLTCVKADGTNVPIACFSWGFTIAADGTVTKKDATSLPEVPDDWWKAVEKFENTHAASAFGVKLDGGLTRIGTFPWSPTDSLGVMNSTNRTMCDMWVHLYQSVASTTPHPIDKAVVIGKDWTVAVPAGANANGEFSPPVAWVKLLASGPAECLAPGQHLAVKLGGGPAGTTPENHEVRFYPTNDRGSVIALSEPGSGSDRFIEVPVQDYAPMPSMPPVAQFSIITPNEQPEVVSRYDVFSIPELPILNVMAFFPDTNIQAGIYDGFGGVDLFDPLLPGQELDIDVVLDTGPLGGTRSGPGSVLTVVLFPLGDPTDGPVTPNGRRDFGIKSLEPNPTSGRTSIAFELPRRGVVDVAIYDARGSRVRQLRSSAEAGQGSMVWDGRDDSGRRLAAGMYFVNLRAPGVDSSRKLLVIR